MASACSFDVVSKVDMAEVKNAVNQAMAEIKQRYDFKGSDAEISLDQKQGAITLTADSEPQIKSVEDILESKLVKRDVPLKALVRGAVEKAAGGAVRQVIKLQQGIPVDKAREIVKFIKGLKLKVQSSIKDEQVRVSGKKRDDLQDVITMLKEKDFGVHMQFTNYR